MPTNLPCKQIEKTGNVATPRPRKKKQQQQKKRLTKSTQGTAATRGKEGKKKTEKGGLAYCPATEEVQSNQKQAEGTASSLIKRLFCLFVPLP